MIEVRSSAKEFKELAADMMPIIEDTLKVLNEHGVQDLASLFVSADGYFSFHHLGTEWDFTRTSPSSAPKLKCNHAEEIELGGNSF